MLPVTVTPAARDEIRALGGCLRVSLEDGGCCGTAYVFGLTSDPSDVIFTDDNIILSLSAAAGTVLAGAKLDYGARLNPPRFRVLNNPNTPLRCACNRSFGRPFPGKCTPDCRAYCLLPWHKENK